MDQVESVIRCARKRYAQPLEVEYNGTKFYRVPAETQKHLDNRKVKINSKYGKAQMNIEDAMDAFESSGITPLNSALWCEINDHAFSAKDEDKVALSFKGETKLSCGPCAKAMFKGAQAENDLRPMIDNP